MLTNKINTIEEHLNITSGNRFQLAHLVMKRTNQLIKGAKPSRNLPPELNPRRSGEIPNESFPKVALEELRSGAIRWSHKSDIFPTAPIEGGDSITFTE